MNYMEYETCFTISFFLSLVKKMLKDMLTGMTVCVSPTIKTIYIV
jgi:hypothetical protein